MKGHLTTTCSIVLALAATPAGAEEAQVRLSLEPTAAREVFAMVIVNESESPVALYVDARLAVAEPLREGRRLGRCRASGGEARDGGDDRRFVLLAPGGRASERLDLRYLCFGRILRRLGEADGVRVTYRTRARHDPAGREIWRRPIGPATVELADAPEPAEGAAEPAADGSPELSLRQVGALPDVADGSRVPVTVELRAPRRARIPVVIRPDQFVFQLTPPGGDPVTCSLSGSKVRPLRDFYERLGRRRVTLDLARICPEKALDSPGVYEARPFFGSEHDGDDVGLSAWTGQVDGAPFLLRVRHATRSPGEPVEIEVPPAAVPGGPREEGGGDAR